MCRLTKLSVANHVGFIKLLLKGIATHDKLSHPFYQKEPEDIPECQIEY